MNACYRSICSRYALPLLFWGFASLLAVSAQAATYNVPGDYPTIQAAVSAATGGDTIVVASGTYNGSGNRDIDFGGKALVVRSLSGAATTIIDCGGSSNSPHRGFYFHTGETASAVVSGFTIQNANGTDEGAVFVDSASGPTIQGCVFQNNVSSGNGAGIYSDGTLTVQNCTFTGNRATSGYYQSGGGIYSDGTLTLSDCTFISNQAGEDGGAVDIGGGNATVRNCTFTGNTAIYGGAVFSFGLMTLVNCTSTANTSEAALYVGNAATVTNDIFFGDSSTEISGNEPTPTFCDIAGGYTGTGNINLNPLFVSASANLHLQAASPCFGAGTATGAPILDADGNTRPNPPGMGAYDQVAAVSPPTGLTATAGVDKVTLHWMAPNGISGATYSLYRGTIPGGETFYKTANTATSFVNTYVTTGTTYYYTVKTIVAGQTSAASNEVSATPLTTSLPGAPTSLIAVPGSSQVALTWTAPTGTIASYTLFRGTTASALTVLQSGITATHFTNGLLTNGTTYFYAVAAVNAGGMGPQSAAVSTTPIAIPSAPTGLTAASTVGVVTLNWTASPGTVTYYSVYRGTTAGGEVYYANTGTATSFADTAGVPGTTYYYTVRATNGSGISPASNETSAAPGRSPLPAAPTSLNVTPTSGQVYLIWTPPTGTVTSYILYRGTNTSTLAVYQPNLTIDRFHDTSVANGTTYFYAVAAVNSGGTGPQSTVVSATPVAIPSAPTYLTATAASKSVTLSWTAPGGTVTGYDLYRGTTPGGEAFYQAKIQGTSYVDYYITAGTKYFYTVKAYNGSGIGSASNEVNATP